MKTVIIFFTVLSMLLLLPLCAKAASEEILPELYESLPKDVKDTLPSGSTPEEVINGLSPSFIGGMFESMLGIALGEALKSLLIIVGIITLSAVMRTACDTSGDGVRRGVDFLTGATALLSLFSFLMPIKSLVSDCLSGIGLLIKAALPAITAIGAASGGISSSAVSGVWLTALLTLIEQLAENLAAPLLSACFGILIVSAISRYTDSSDFSEVLGGIKYAVTLILSILGTVFTVIMSRQSVIAKSSDGVLIRSVKFASGNFIPIVGGSLAEAATSYMSGLSVITSSMGMLTTASLIFYILPIILRLAICRIGLDLTSAYSLMLGCKNEASIIKEAKAILDLCLALISLCSIIFIIAVSVFAKTVIS